MTSLLLLATVRELLDWVRAWLSDARGRAVARREFRALDSATLRDLGLGSSEFDSLCAEANGSAERTRRRVAIRPPAPSLDPSPQGGLCRADTAGSQGVG
jgi:hypothetical protein